MSYSDREILSMLDFIHDYDFDYSQASPKQIANIVKKALVAGWEA